MYAINLKEISHMCISVKLKFRIPRSVVIVDGRALPQLLKSHPSSFPSWREKKTGGCESDEILHQVKSRLIKLQLQRFYVYTARCIDQTQNGAWGTWGGAEE